MSPQNATPPHILVVDDDPGILRLLTMRLRSWKCRVSTAATAEEALARIAIDPPQLLLSDVRLPGRDGAELFAEIHQMRPTLPVILMTAHGSIPDAVEAMSRGVFGYLTKPFDSQALHEKIEQALKVSPAGNDTANTQNEAWQENIIYRSHSMAALLEEARIVAASEANVLIRGASGTGKELLARAIHRASRRAKAPFVAINCGAIPEQLLESELFGHVRGAFTGAVSEHDGLFRAADGGTLFLDEIGDMSLALQVKLLRVLEERAVRPVGATRSQPVDVRLLAATHRDLENALAEGQFREDLYYRIDVVTLTLPSLEERREDIPALAAHFIRKISEKYEKNISGIAADALAALVSASWPGNIRQLFNVIEQCCALTTTTRISLPLVQRALRSPAMDALSYADAKQRFERNYLIQLLKLTDGNVADAARIAGRNRTEFYRLLRKHELTPSMFRGDTGLPATSSPGEGKGDAI